MLTLVTNVTNPDNLTDTNYCIAQIIGKRPIIMIILSLERRRNCSLASLKFLTLHTFPFVYHLINSMHKAIIIT